VHSCLHPGGNNMATATIDERKSKPGPFQNSLTALAQVAQEGSGAEGYAFFRRRADAEELTPHIAAGKSVDSGHVVTYPLGDDGVFALVFADSARRGRAEGIVAAIASVWTAARSTPRYSELASHVADLETRLLDSRISDRVRGYLSAEGQSGAFETIIRHVQSVLSPKPAESALEKLSQELEQEVEERRLTNRAKAILRSVHGMSEEQAHVHLRQTSRKTRRKIKEIAEDLIRNYSEGEILRVHGC